MSTQTLAAADALLKDMYVGPMVEQLNKKTYMLDQIERDSDHIDHTGRRAVIPLHTGRNRGRGARGAGGTLPVAGTQNYNDAIVKLTYQYAGIEIEDALVEASKTNEGAFINALQGETKGAAEDLRKDMNRQIFGSGDGLLATINGSFNAQTTLTLDTVQYLEVGDPVDVVKKSDGSATAGVTSTTVTAKVGGATKTITLANATAGTVDANFGVYIAGSRVNETNGLRNIIGKNRTLHGINSAEAGNSAWNSPIIEVGESSSNPSVAGESSFEKLADDVGASGNGEAEAFLTTRGIRRRLADQYQSQKRYNDAQAVKIHGGYSAIFVNEIPVIADDDAPKGWAFATNKDSFRWVEQAGPDWMKAPNSDGSIFHLKDGATPGSKVAVYQAWFKWYTNLANVAPNRNGALTFCQDDNPA